MSAYDYYGGLGGGGVESLEPGGQSERVASDQVLGVSLVVLALISKHCS